MAYRVVPTCKTNDICQANGAYKFLLCLKFTVLGLLRVFATKNTFRKVFGGSWECLVLLGIFR